MDLSFVALIFDTFEKILSMINWFSLLTVLIVTMLWIGTGGGRNKSGQVAQGLGFRRQLKPILPRNGALVGNTTASRRAIHYLHEALTLTMYAALSMCGYMIIKNAF